MKTLESSWKKTWQKLFLFDRLAPCQPNSSTGMARYPALKKIAVNHSYREIIIVALYKRSAQLII